MPSPVRFAVQPTAPRRYDGVLSRGSHLNGRGVWAEGSEVSAQALRTRPADTPSVSLSELSGWERLGGLKKCLFFGKRGRSALLP